MAGKAKELAGELANNDDLAREGRLQQAQGETAVEAAEARTQAQQADAAAQLEEDKVETAEERQRLEAEIEQRRAETAAEADREQAEEHSVKEAAGEIRQAEAKARAPAGRGRPAHRHRREARGARPQPGGARARTKGARGRVKGRRARSEGDPMTALKTIPKATVNGAISWRASADTVLRAAPESVATSAGLAVDRADATVRSAAGTALRDEQLRDEAKRLRGPSPSDVARGTARASA